MKSGVILDNFQPLHNRQTSLIDQAYKECDLIYILIEESNAPISITHPYKGVAVFEILINYILKSGYDINKFKIKYLFDMPDVSYYINYIEWVLKTKDVIYYSNNKNQIDFLKNNNRNVRESIYSTGNKTICEKIGLKCFNNDWKQYTPEVIHQLLEKHFMGKINFEM